LDSSKALNNESGGEVRNPLVDDKLRILVLEPWDAAVVHVEDVADGDGATNDDETMVVVVESSKKANGDRRWGDGVNDCNPLPISSSSVWNVESWYWN
jgi:hypothetical protein